jgi:hypothetical protein
MCGQAYLLLFPVSIPQYFTGATMARCDDMRGGGVSTFLHQWATQSPTNTLEIPDTLPRSLHDFALRIEDYIESDRNAVRLLQQSCQRVVVDIANALRIAHWEQRDTIAFLTGFVEWSLGRVSCYSTETAHQWLAQQMPSWISTVYTPAPVTHDGGTDILPKESHGPASRNTVRQSH